MLPFNFFLMLILILLKGSDERAMKGPHIQLNLANPTDLTECWQTHSHALLIHTYVTTDTRDQVVSVMLDIRHQPCCTVGVCACYVCVWERLTGGFVLEERESLFEMNIFFVCRSFSYEKSYSWSITYSWGFCWGFSLSSFPPSLHPLFSQLMLKQSHWTQINSSLLILFEIGYWVCVWCCRTKRRLKVKVQWM